jgi:cobalt-zinc-cadmium efflux system protein
MNGQVSNYGRAFAVGILLNLAYVVVEAAAGVLSNSLTLIADAGHNLSDVLSLLLAWGAATLAQRRPSAQFTYGLRSSTIMAALVNAMVLLVVSGAIAWEAVLRFKSPSTINGQTMIWVALIGVVINAATAMLFRKGGQKDFNIRGAFLHMAADAAVSLGVVLTGLAVLATGWLWLDTVVSLAIVAVIFFATWDLLRDSIRLVLHAVPPGVNPADVRQYLASLEGVKEVHDLHIWGMSTTETALTAHLVMPAGSPGDEFISRITCEIGEKFHIGHATLQIETGATECHLAPDHVV